VTLAAQQGGENAPGDAGSDDDYFRVQDSSIRSAAETPGLRRQAPYCSVCMGGGGGGCLLIPPPVGLLLLVFLSRLLGI
jgi:hypothetical protein